jgi:hypothetical protein
VFFNRATVLLVHFETFFNSACSIADITGSGITTVSVATVSVYHMVATGKSDCVIVDVVFNKKIANLFTLVVNSKFDVIIFKDWMHVLGYYTVKLALHLACSYGTFDF